jgi:glycosyltransferase involved in cell wall biosynthesis
LIRVAFIKFGGLSAGGTERFLQTIAINLDREVFDVTYFYCDAAPYIGSDTVHATTDPYRLAAMREAGVRLVKFRVGAKDVSRPSHPWRDSNFFELFDERDYDIVQSGRAGHPEFPFTHIRHTPIVDSIHFLGGIDNQANIARVMHLSEWSARQWAEAGGDAGRVSVVSHPMERSSCPPSFRAELDLDGKLVFGFHQRASDEIFSPMPLEAYGQIANEHTHFVLLGGGERYRKQAAELALTSVTFLPHSGDARRISAFLATLDVYAHGRKDGEINSMAMAEAMGMGLPIVSHRSAVNNGHVECIGEAGAVVDSSAAYADELRRHRDDTGYRSMRSAAALRQFDRKYELKGQMRQIEAIYRDVVDDPFPNRGARMVAGVIQDMTSLARDVRARIRARGHRLDRQGR